MFTLAIRNKLFVNKPNKYFPTKRTNNKIICNCRETEYPILYKKFGDFNLELLSDGNICVLTKDKYGRNYEQSKFNIPGKYAVHEYARIMLKTVGDPSNKKILVLGSAGASIPYSIICNHYNTDVTIVDNSLDSINIGKYIGKYIVSNNKSSIKWHLNDAQNFIMTVPKNSYDIIICDIFNINDGVIPPFVNEINFLKKIKSSLNDKGIYLENILDNSPDNYCYNLSNVFSNIYFMQDDSSHKNPRRNFVFIAR